MNTNHNTTPDIRTQSAYPSETRIEQARLLKADIERLLKTENYKRKPAFKKWVKEAKAFCGYDPKSRPVSGLLFYVIRKAADLQKIDNPYGSV